jgi:aspartyl protease
LRGALPLLLLSSCAARRTGAPPLPSLSLEEAYAAYRAARFGRSEEILARLQEPAGSADRDLLEGLLLASRGRTAEAVAALERALRSPGLDPSALPAIHLEAARLCLDAGDVASAARHAREAGPIPSAGLLLRLAEALPANPYRVVGATSGEIPLRLEPFAEVAAGLGGGVEARLVVDTAASVCVLARSVAGRAGIRSLGEEEALDLFGGKTAAGLGTIPEISIGEARVRDVPVLLVDDEVLSFRFGDLRSSVRAEGVIGLGLLRRFRTTLEFERGAIRLDPPGMDPPSGAIDARVVGGGLLLSGGANGVGGLPFLLDSGTNRSSLTSLGADAIADRVRVVAAPGSGGTVGGGVTFLRRALGVRFEFGRWIVDPLDVPIVGEGRETGIVRAGVIGLDVLRAFRVVLEPGAGWALVERGDAGN